MKTEIKVVMLYQKPKPLVVGDLEYGTIFKEGNSLWVRTNDTHCLLLTNFQSYDMSHQTAIQEVFDKITIVAGDTLQSVCPYCSKPD